MKDGAWRGLVKRLARWRYETDLAVTRRLRDHRGEGSIYLLGGRCTGCGACCETPMIPVNRWLFHARVWRRLFLAWQRRINGFVHLGEDRASHTFVFRCTHYDAATRQCDSYATRPGMCRDYPRNLLDDPVPEFLPQCGHFARHPQAELVRQSLRELDLPPEKLADLERRFRVDRDDEDRQPPRAA